MLLTVSTVGSPQGSVGGDRPGWKSSQADTPIRVCDPMVAKTGQDKASLGGGEHQVCGGGSSFNKLTGSSSNSVIHVDNLEEVSVCILESSFNKLTSSKSNTVYTDTSLLRPDQADHPVL